MPDAPGLELLAQTVRDAHPEAVLDTTFFRGQAAIHVEPSQLRGAIEVVRDAGFRYLASVHGLDYYPEEPRLGVQYELIDMDAVDRIALKLRVSTDAPRVMTVTDLFPAANHQEREVYDMFGVVFEGHPDLRRILMPEDYEGHPQRRDFPLGGEPIIFTYNEKTVPGWTE